MAALVEGQQYGLSAQDKINGSKSVVFVKLTDSALRSIEEYAKFKDIKSRPTIQFQNSNGVISLPQNGSSQTYGFTLSNVEADGPHGSFECLRQLGNRSLESLGCMQVKMHIHANEDSYENTRVKMAAVEKEQKKSCTKVIKPAGAHLGRKVKLKRPGLVVSPVKFSPPASSMVSKPPVKPIIAPVSSSLPPLPIKKPEAPKPPIPQPPKNPELMRQPIRDRIIHILAVRPYKRPELLVRLRHEGVREKDKNKLTSILPQVSILKGNIYYLANFLWNEVQDNWKFCSQEEAEIIHKRKQQHLCSHSEIETSPPNSQPNTSPLQKRIASEALTNGHPPSKKTRISHYKGDPQRPSYNGNSMDVSSNFHKKTAYSPGPFQSNCNGGGHEEDPTQKSPLSYGSDSHLTVPTKTSDVLPNHRSVTREDQERSIRNHTSGHPRQTEKGPRIPREELGHRYTSSADVIPKNYVNSDIGKSQTLSHPRSVDSNCDSPKAQVSPDSQVKETKGNACSKTNGYVNNIKIKYSSNQSSYVNNRSKVTSTTNGSCSSSPHSSSDSRDSMDCNDSYGKVSNPTESPALCDSPEYEKEYCQIVSNEQRARYKANFNAEYDEYLRLHRKIIGISKKFTRLEGDLNTCTQGSPAFKKISGRIYKEYKAYQQNPNYLQDVKKFNFLHTKLAHIKKLVTDYDNARAPSPSLQPSSQFPRS